MQMHRAVPYYITSSTASLALPCSSKLSRTRQDCRNKNNLLDTKCVF